MRIETERLILRNIDPERDFESWARTMGDERTVRFLDGKVLDRAAAWRHMASLIGHWVIRGYGSFSVEVKETGEWVGRVGPWYPEGWPAPEIGWTISPDHWGKGYATEAARASVEYAFNTLGWSQVIHVILVGNDASIAVAKQLGSTFIRTVSNTTDLTPKAAAWLSMTKRPRRSGVLDTYSRLTVNPSHCRHR
jgi:RimJ/RimL family protein N-acetyltransferase